MVYFECNLIFLRVVFLITTIPYPDKKRLLHTKCYKINDALNDAGSENFFVTKIEYNFMLSICGY